MANENQIELIRRAIECAGSQVELAKAMEVTRQAVWQWSKGIMPVSALSAIKIEHATGGRVTRLELRPDIFAQ